MKSKIVLGAFISVITLLVCSTAISFAWYDSSDVLKIENMEVTLRSDSELLIGLKNSKDKKDYSDIIKQSQLKKVEKFKPVSSMCSSAWIETKSQNPIFYDSSDMGDTIFVPGDPGYVLPSLKEATTGFFSQELYLYTESDEYAAVLDSATNLVPDLTKNVATAKKLAEEHPEMGSEAQILAKLNSLVNSARISVLATSDDFYSFKIVDPYKQSNSETMLGGLLDSDLNGEYDYWTLADNTKYEILFGDIKNRDKIVYKYNSESPEPMPIEERTWYHANHSGQTFTFDSQKSEENGLEINKEHALSITENAALTAKLLNHGTLTPEEKAGYMYVPLKAFTPMRIVLSIYFEGWDLDNINDTMAGSFTTDIAFSTINKSLINVL